MMDPLSILSGILTIAGSTIAALRFAEEINNAPTEVVLLLDDSSSLRILLENLEAVLKNSPQDVFAPYEDFLASLLQRAESNLSEVQLIITTRLTRRKSVSSATLNPPRIGSLRALSRLREIHSSLASVKSSLTVMLGVIAASEAARSNKALEHMVAAQALDRRHDMMGDILAKIQHLSDYLLVAPTPAVDSNKTAITSNISIHNNVIQMMESRPRESWFSSPTGVKPPADAYAAEQAVVDEEDEEDEDTEKNREGGIKVESDIIDISTTIPNSIPTTNSCLRSCRCRCHSLRRMSTPAALTLFFGSFNLEYVAAPLITGSCNRRDCTRQSDIGIRMSYFFPPWLLLRTLLATVIRPKMQGVRIDLQAPRSVPSSSLVFEYARNGNTQGLRQLFDGGEASPHDTDEDTGSTALTYAIDQHQIATWRFLLNSGADPFQMNRARQSAIDNAVNKLMANIVGPEFAAAIRVDFDVQEYLQDREFVGLHMSVLGLINIPLKTYLDAHADQINARDWQGRTALSWASARGDADVVNFLLNCNADPNIASNNKSSPLHFASRATQTDCIKLLVDAGASVNSRNIWDVDALSYAIRADDLVERIAPLVEGGADLTRTGDDNALFLAARHNHWRQTAYLLSKGTTFPQQSDCDKTLRVAMEMQHSETVELLLHHIKASPVTFGVETIRKTAMKLGDKSMIQLITKILHAR